MRRSQRHGRPHLPHHHHVNPNEQPLTEAGSRAQECLERADHNIEQAVHSLLQAYSCSYRIDRNRQAAFAIEQKVIALSMLMDMQTFERVIKCQLSETDDETQRLYRIVPGLRPSSVPLSIVMTGRAD